MSDEWVVLELSPKAEGEDPDILRRSIQNLVKGAEVFIPASVTVVGDDRVVQYLVDGYAFVRRTLPDEKYIKLEGSRYVQSVITKSMSHAKDLRHLACVTSVDIDRMRGQLQVESDQGIGVGDTVRITSGAYRQILATVIEDIPEEDKVQVEVRLRSKESLVTLPRSFLRLVTKAPRPPYFDKLESFKHWLRAASAVAVWPKESRAQVLQLHKKLVRVEQWLRCGLPLEQFVGAFGITLDPKGLVEQARVAEMLTGWVERGSAREPLFQTFDVKGLKRKAAEYARLLFWLDHEKSLTDFLGVLYNATSLSPLESKYLDWLWLHDVTERLGQVASDVDSIGRVLESESGVAVVQNIIIDGHNLAFRCLYAPGVSSLTDSQQRPTGVIFGFLRSLAAFQKRFPGARLYVTWDGSSQRRKASFADYKANRGERVAVGFDQIGWLREFLPLVGVYQAYNADEEADDVIASLVRGPLQGQRNLIVSTDRDLLQLVTETDHVLAPAQGGKKETIFDPAAVVAGYGVPPAKMPILRAFLGDSSDNIPGVPRVPAKIVTALVKLYGTVDGVYASNLAGLTKFQYAKIRESEAQVRLNARLMALDIRTPFVLVDPDADQTVATGRLQDVDMKADSLLGTFFASGAVRRVEHERVRDSG